MKKLHKKLKQKEVIASDVKSSELESMFKQIGGSHYMYFDIQPAEFININKLLFAEGNAIKYICRHSKKGGIQDIDKAIQTMQSNLEFHDAIYEEGNEYEVPAIKELFGIAWKGKADIITKDKIIDLKTTSNIKDFKYSARKYNYDSQAWLYKQLFGKSLVFYAIDKSTFELGIFEPSETFLEYGKNKVEKALEIYNKFYGNNATENIENYIIKEIL